MMNWRGTGLLAWAMMAGIGFARAQTGGCTTERSVTRCDKTAFVAALAEAKSVVVQAGPRDRVAAGQLKELAGKLGKPVSGDGELVFSLDGVDTEGVMVGPAGTELATLRVSRAGSGMLVWVETLMGQPDMSWPARVHAVIQQFQGQFGRK